MDTTYGSRYKTLASKTTCLICNASMSVSTRTSRSIYEDRVTTTDRPVIAILNKIMGFNLSEADYDTDVICKKCFKRCEEIDELEGKVSNIKSRITNIYTKTSRSLSDSKSPENDVRCDDESNESSIINIRGRRPSNSLKNYTDSIQHDDDDDANDAEIDIIELFPSPTRNDICSKDNNVDGLESEIIEIGADDLSSYKTTSIDTIQSNIINNNVITSTEFVKPKDKYQSNVQSQKTSKSSNVLVTRMVISREKFGMYKCLLCPPEKLFKADAREIMSHFKSTHSMNLFICDVCGDEFLKRYDLTAHLWLHMDHENSDEEHDSHSDFGNVRLPKTRTSARDNDPKNYTCEICGKIYKSQVAFEDHINGHSIQKPNSCLTCGKIFGSKHDLKAHEKTHNVRSRSHSCINCGKSFFTMRNLILHEKIHSKIKNYVCEECGESFRTANHLETHFEKHIGFKPHICRMCGKTFSTNAELLQHQQTHNGETPFLCEFCGAGFAQLSNLHVHKKLEHYEVKRYKCTDCGKAFNRRRLLDYHMKSSHTGERPLTCEICGNTFIHPEHFKKHQLIHIGEKPYKCEGEMDHR